MDRENICGLIEKYMEGQTSLCEEQQLRDYFRNGEVAPEVEMYAPMFEYFSREREIPQASFSIHPERKSGKHLWMVFLAAAACALLLFALNRRNIPGEWPPSDEKHSMAYIDARKYTDIETICTETLNSLANLEEGTGDISSLQVEVLELFTDEEFNN
jgi:hypothetical protein